VPLDDERFEAYLKQFRPLDPEPLPEPKSRRQTRARFFLWAGAAAAVVILGGVALLRIRTEKPRAVETNTYSAIPDRLTDGKPLTMRSANALMAKTPSFKALVDDMAFHSRTIPLPNGKRSAVAELSKEKIKL